MAELPPRLGYVFQLNRPGVVPAPTAANISGGDFLRADGTWQSLGLVGNYVPITRRVNNHPLSADVVVTKSDIGLGLVENTALSTWGGSSNIVTVGTVTAGVWAGTPIGQLFGGVPPGGNTNEVLTKVSNSDYDVEWRPAAGGIFNLDGGDADDIYGGVSPVDGGGA